MRNHLKNRLNIKVQLHKLCVDYVENRYLTVQNYIEQIHESLLTETKSSVGDKHETGRAMLQLEREKAGQQLVEAEKIKENLSKIDITKTSNIIGLGTVVYTNQANYFIAISAGKIQIEEDSFFAISPNTPIGLLLIGKEVGNNLVFRNQKFKILQLL